MKRRFTEQQIHDILKESEAGANSLELCRKYGISKNTFYKRHSKSGGMELSDLKKMRKRKMRKTFRKAVGKRVSDIMGLESVVEKKRRPGSGNGKY